MDLSWKIPQYLSVFNLGHSQNTTLFLFKIQKTAALHQTERQAFLSLPPSLSSPLPPSLPPTPRPPSTTYTKDVRWFPHPILLIIVFLMPVLTTSSWGLGLCCTHHCTNLHTGTACGSRHQLASPAGPKPRPQGHGPKPVLEGRAGVLGLCKTGGYGQAEHDLLVIWSNHIYAQDKPFKYMPELLP